MRVRASHRPSGSRWTAVRPGASALAFALAGVLAGCSSSAAEPTERLPPVSTGVQVEEGLTYWSDATTSLQLDACLPPDRSEGVDGSSIAIVIVHGGGFTDGDRAGGGSRELCETAAEFGQAAFSIDYRLAPDHHYPAQVDDLAHAVQWLRAPEQAERFGIDPSRIGVIGSSAGAIIAQSLATRGQGPLDTGERVGAVVSLSGVSVMTPEGLQLGEPSSQAVQLVLTYLGCSSPQNCPQGAAASAITAVDPSDPPMYLVNGLDELVPREQADAMAAALTQAGVPVETMIVDAPDHGTALLNGTVRQGVLAFLEEHL